jgi:DNA-binding CsgD family transcriptional regulator
MIDDAVLSDREQEILRLVATGASNKEIALKLLISPNTVKVHLRNIFAKIGVVSRTEATLYAIRHGIATAPARLPAGSNGDGSGLPDGNPTPTALPAVSLAPFSISSADDGKVNSNGSLAAAPTSLRWRRLTIITGVSALVIVLVVVALGAASRLGQAAPKATPSANLATAENRWQAKAALPENVKSMAAAVYDKYLYLISGETPGGITGAVYQYTINTSTWEKKKAKPTPVADVMAVLLGEKIYVPGGRASSGQPVNLLEVFDPRHDVWETKAPLPVAVSRTTWTRSILTIQSKTSGQNAPQCRPRAHLQAQQHSPERYSSSVATMGSKPWQPMSSIILTGMKMANLPGSNEHRCPPAATRWG